MHSKFVMTNIHINFKVCISMFSEVIDRKCICLWTKQPSDQHV